jgi:DNA invertase Pin-like site-specific DNA recombinase
VVENGESTQRQHALRDRAVAAGWPIERIQVIDGDLGRSGAQVAGRDGFQRLVSEVALGKAGIVMGLEVSRLARNSADWAKLVGLGAITATLLLDEDAIHDAASFNDRLLLGLKGTMSEAELPILKARLRGGRFRCNIPGWSNRSRQSAASGGSTEQRRDEGTLGEHRAIQCWS